MKQRDSSDRNVHPNIQNLKKDYNSLQVVSENEDKQISNDSYHDISELYNDRDSQNEQNNLKFNTLFKKDSDRVA